MMDDERFDSSGQQAEPLITDLRKAYEYHVDALAAPGSCWLGDQGGASEAYGGASDAAALPEGARLGDFEIVETLGRGGMGVVYRARQISLDREVALKVLPGYARHGGAAVKRFQIEARAAGRVQHTNVVPIYAQGEHADHYFYAMELVDGISLDKVIHDRPDLLGSTRILGGSSDGWRFNTTRIISSESASDHSGDPAETATSENGSAPLRTTADYRHVAMLLAEVAEGLECAHQQGVIHRDVKPHNLLLSTQNRLHLTDFGLARLTEEPHITIEGEIMGTPAYLSPEQVCGGGAIDHRTDVYSLGVTLYEIITGRKPFDGQNRAQILSRIANNDPEKPRRFAPRIPVDLETICLRAMDKTPARRHASAAELAEDLKRFSEGRPILSRKIGRLRKGIKWIVRHKAVSWVIGLSMLAILLASGWAWSARDARLEAARALVRGAYEQMAFQDYRSPERAAVLMDRAEQMGADSVDLHLARALAALGGMDQASAIEHLEDLLEGRPNDIRAMYMLAWARQRSGDVLEANDVFEAAESMGGPKSADAWFFRGLSIHNARPDLAVESYREAIALRSREHGFFPQAVLHLARARNQQLYATRNLVSLPEALESLRQLVEHQSYGAYPHYLLSITHRLAAEIYSGSEGTRDNSYVDEHYAKALEWARNGQRIDPTNDRPITAEAECLESMGRYAEAVEARTRAIETASGNLTRWEGYHYRWRLHYWLEEYELAAADIDACAQYDPQNIFYSHVYPMLLAAETGDMDSALVHARALADQETDDAASLIWSSSCLRLLGQTGEANAMLANNQYSADYAGNLEPPQTAEWMQRLYAAVMHGEDPRTLEDFAARWEMPWRLWGGAYFHAGMRLLGVGEREAALQAMRRAYRSFDSETAYSYQGKLIYNKMRMNFEWPGWIVVESEDGCGIQWEQEFEKHIEAPAAVERDEP